MSEQANERMIRNLYDAFGRGDIPTILNMLADDVDWYDPGPPAVTHAGRYRGRDDMLRFFSRIGESLAIETFQPTEFIAKGDRVIVLGSLRAKVKQTGLVYNNEWATFLDAARRPRHEMADLRGHRARARRARVHGRLTSPSRGEI